MTWQPLLCHPATGAGAETQIEAEATLAKDGLRLRYRLRGAIARLVLPPPRPPARQDGLWRHTCFEAFVAVPGQPGYLEFNFSPSGEWAVYAFSAYREAAALPALPAPEIGLRCDDGQLELSAGVEIRNLLPAAAALRLGLSAVIEDQDGGLSYWALQHPAERPDFHHPGSFVLERAPPR